MLNPSYFAYFVSVRRVFLAYPLLDKKYDYLEKLKLPAQCFNSIRNMYYRT